jgi:hypothetical protein
VRSETVHSFTSPWNPFHCTETIQPNLLEHRGLSDLGTTTTFTTREKWKRLDYRPSFVYTSTMSGTIKINAPNTPYLIDTAFTNRVLEEKEAITIVIHILSRHRKSATQ